MTDKEQKALYRFIMYDQIHRFRREEHKSIQWIADYLGVNYIFRSIVGQQFQPKTI